MAQKRPYFIRTIKHLRPAGGTPPTGWELTLSCGHVITVCIANPKAQDWYCSECLRAYRLKHSTDAGLDRKNPGIS